MPERAGPPLDLDKSEQRIRRMFGEISPRYDFLNHFLSGGIDWYWRWRTVRAAAPSGEAPILDVCTGTGDLALAYWKKGRGRIPVVGADFTREMLEIADQKALERQKKSRGAGDPPVFFQADAQQLPFADDVFQIVCVAFGLRNVTDTTRGLKEMVRVCRHGGRVVVLEFSLPANRVLRGLYAWYFRNILPRIGQLFARNTQNAYNYLPESVSEFPHGQKLAQLMQDCGLRTVRFTPLTFGIATLYFGEK
ncbi:MAG TPA: bifunctional demethylmenaquinone methyltransferase/2-methoxy-6-polyprenyl-1,4-benzoquinol methylase UbiE [Planctomycetaceae bacterium]|nr:bifunctional demethylmenaquinone methyltransferase/2-methoxy-6-polyprenyl-1,4-benzoquinol methylase UbiE [Planctomycetaceae bacterium]